MRDESLVLILMQSHIMVTQRRQSCLAMPLTSLHGGVDAGSLDRTVKLWDLSAGMQIATSRYQPSAVRALALDARMLVCSASKVCGHAHH